MQGEARECNATAKHVEIHVATTYIEKIEEVADRDFDLLRSICLERVTRQLVFLLVMQLFESPRDPLSKFLIELGPNFRSYDPSKRDERDDSVVDDENDDDERSSTDQVLVGVEDGSHKNP